MPPTLRLVIEDDDGRRQVVPLAADEVGVGRAAPGNAVRLPERNVSRHHARLFRQNGALWVEDLGSRNGTLLNGERVEGRRRLRPGDLLQIGDYDLALEEGEALAPPGPEESESPTLPAVPPVPPPLPRAEPPAAPPPPAPAAVPAAAVRPRPAARAWVYLAIGVASLALGYAAGRLVRSAPPAAPATAAESARADR